ncbi:Na(+)-translocating NADH-quinone reductase subunit F [Tamlana sedimentorum]|uniref:Na(+)-translocating NADH-quinone reductase subunit F n=1 Tax=Neotamlana sedimentorum TaxID=1435349 RepID=A0A0D7W9L5_9FLAO|nr:hypothetical protein [Tamlana sedimentorum]KJD35831.1 Na(+)-translocating NADH-quinone reductase subunit F [Tamlana sedimentorum]
MQNVSRLENAVQKLYIAFNSNSLNPECCKQCAVGNILDNTDNWKHFSDVHGSINLNYIGRVNQLMGKRFNGYSPEQILKIETTFLKACGYQLPFNHKSLKPENATDKDTLFIGLCEVIKLLCDFEGVDDVLNYTKLFTHNNEKTPKSIRNNSLQKS